MHEIESIGNDYHEREPAYEVQTEKSRARRWDGPTSPYSYEKIEKKRKKGTPAITVRYLVLHMLVDGQEVGVAPCRRELRGAFQASMGFWLALLVPYHCSVLGRARVKVPVLGPVLVPKPPRPRYGAGRSTS